MAAACYPERDVLRPLAAHLFFLVLENATVEQWVGWLRVPLEHAAARGERDAFTKLMSAGADTSAGWRGCHGRTLLHAAAEGGDDVVVSDLLQAGAGENLAVVSGPERTSALHRAIASNHEAAAGTLFLAGAPKDLADSQKRTPLHLAAQQGHTQLACNLLLSGANPDPKDSCDQTPLHIASSLGHDQIVRALVHRGADKDVLDSCGATPLNLASHSGHVTAAKVLLLAGADANFQNNEQCLSAVHVAAVHGNVDVLTALLQHGGDVHGRVNTSGHTALHIAAIENQASAIRLLVDAGADIEAQLGDTCWTPLHCAASSAACDAALALLERGANVGAQTSGGESPLHLVVKRLRARLADVTYNTVDVLLRWGADEKATAPSGNTPEEYMKEARHWTPSVERVITLLRNAPRDRVWRRRGWLIMIRSSREDTGVVVKRNSGAMPARMHDSDGSFGRINNGANADTAVTSAAPFDDCSGTGAGSDDWTRLVWGVLGLGATEVFRRIVEFV